MKFSFTARWLKRFIASIVLVTYAVGCTHLPTGEKAFDSFESCFSANLGLAALAGVGIGVISTQLASGFTDRKSTASAVGVAAGIAAAAMIATAAWRKCAAVYSKSVPLPNQGGAQPVQAPPRARPQQSLNFDRLDVRVEGNENTAPVPEFNFTYFSENPAAKDIKAKFRHKVEIVRFAADKDEKLILAGANGEPLLDGSGKTIPVEAAAKMPRERLSWVPIAEEGKDEYTEDVVIQQGQRITYKHQLQVPQPSQLHLPLPLPMRYTLTIEAEGAHASRTVDFALLPTADRPKHYVSQAGTASSANAATRALGNSGSTTAANLKAKRRAALYREASPKSKIVGYLAKGMQVRVEDESQVEQNRQQVRWVKVVPVRGVGGWLAAHELE